jgi:hypothetical protein
MTLDAIALCQATVYLETVIQTNVHQIVLDPPWPMTVSVLLMTNAQLASVPQAVLVRTPALQPKVLVHTVLDAIAQVPVIVWQEDALTHSVHLTVPVTPHGTISVLAHRIVIVVQTIALTVFARTLAFWLKASLLTVMDATAQQLLTACQVCVPLTNVLQTVPLLHLLTTVSAQAMMSVHLATVHQITLARTLVLQPKELALTTMDVSALLVATALQHCVTPQPQTPVFPTVPEHQTSGKTVSAQVTQSAYQDIALLKALARAHAMEPKDSGHTWTVATAHWEATVLQTLAHWASVPQTALEAPLTQTTASVQATWSAHQATVQLEMLARTLAQSLMAWDLIWMDAIVSLVLTVTQQHALWINAHQTAQVVLHIHRIVTALRMLSAAQASVRPATLVKTLVHLLKTLVPTTMGATVQADQIAYPLPATLLLISVPQTALELVPSLTHVSAPATVNAPLTSAHPTIASLPAQPPNHTELTRMGVTVQSSVNVDLASVPLQTCASHHARVLEPPLTMITATALQTASATLASVSTITAHPVAVTLKLMEATVMAAIAHPTMNACSALAPTTCVSQHALPQQTRMSHSMMDVNALSTVSVLQHIACQAHANHLVLLTSQLNPTLMTASVPSLLSVHLNIAYLMLVSLFVTWHRLLDLMIMDVNALWIQSVLQVYATMELVNHLVLTHMPMDHSLMDVTVKSMENANRLLAVLTLANQVVQAPKTQGLSQMDANAQLILNVLQTTVTAACSANHHALRPLTVSSQMDVTVKAWLNAPHQLVPLQTPVSHIVKLAMLWELIQ